MSIRVLDPYGRPLTPVPRPETRSRMPPDNYPVVAREELSPLEYRAAELRRLGLSRTEVALVLGQATEKLLARISAKLGSRWLTDPNILWDPIPQSRRDAAQAYRLLTTQPWGTDEQITARTMLLTQPIPGRNGSPPVPRDLVGTDGRSYVPQARKVQRDILRDRTVTLRLLAATSRAGSASRIVTLTPTARFLLRPLLEQLTNRRQANCIRVDRFGERLGDRPDELWYRAAHRGTRLPGATYEFDLATPFLTLVRAYVESGDVWFVIHHTESTLAAWEEQTGQRVTRPNWQALVRDTLASDLPEPPDVEYLRRFACQIAASDLATASDLAEARG